MQVSKWGNSLAVRFPAGLVQALDLKEGEEIELHLVGARSFEVVKSPSVTELLARLRALIRRASGQASAVLQCGDWSMDTRSGRVTCAGQPVTLTAHEYKVLSYLIHHQGRVVPRTELVEHIYDQDFDRDSNTIEVFVTRIRKKLGQDVISTIRGLGYSLEEPVN